MTYTDEGLDRLARAIDAVNDLANSINQIGENNA